MEIKDWLTGADLDYMKELYAQGQIAMQGTSALQNAYNREVMRIASNGNLGIGAMPGAAATYKPFTPNECEAYAVPLSVLKDMWIAKFGDKWAGRTDVVGDAFWDLASHRLIQANAMETIDGRDWYRLKE